MLKKTLILAGILSVFNLTAEDGKMNLLLNPDFDFHSFTNHRDGKAESYTSNNVAFWNTDAWKDITVLRESHADPKIRPDFSVHNMVSIAPGKKFWQFFSLPEAGLAHGETLSLSVYGYQNSANALKASIKYLKIESEDGEWKPQDFKLSDKRSFPKHARGELVTAKQYDATTDKTGNIELKINDAKIPGKFTIGAESHSADINTIGICVEFENTAKDGNAWIYSPCLNKGTVALSGLQPARQMAPYYRYIPRTIQKLWKGEPIHIILMGSSIDRGSANPPMYLYNEDPNSPDFKKPIGSNERIFDAKQVNRPDLDGYFGWWQHYFSYGGRLKMELMRKFNLPASKICLNIMACDGSCVGEAHSGLEEYCSLSLPPEEGVNGHKKGAKWDELYPGLFSRPEGPRPDLVIFGSGANEKTDTPDEVAVFEGMIRWIQRHYPNTEFIFCQFQNNGGYTPNPGDLQALALRYQIPFMDYGKVGDDIARWCNKTTLVPKDGHPQAVAHYIWSKQLEKAFECWDPIVPGQAQLQLPERVHVNSYGWEGEMLTYNEKSPRIKDAKFIFDDTAVNAWGGTDEGVTPEVYVDGIKLPMRRTFMKRDIRNSFIRYGRCSFGDRHILEVLGKGAKLTAVDAKICPDRRFFGIDNPLWKKPDTPIADFKSEWGAPYGSKQLVLKPGESIEINAVCTDISAAYLDSQDGGDMKVLVDGKEKLLQPTNIPFTDIEKKTQFIENRKGIRGLPYGMHTIRIEAVKAPVTVLGLFTYDSRPNRDFERRLTGLASAGETLTFSLPFKARPMIISNGELRAEIENTSPEKVTFSGKGNGSFEVIGE
ncbi:MAG: hypothetical protein A2017_22015 [Lentisphaerae bacterium GWF2_44_16]|nr:MAG: hypothetical protein A2017_22015 [Lentisphaerae bacterium GWF2_44_16]